MAKRQAPDPNLLDSDSFAFWWYFTSTRWQRFLVHIIFVLVTLVGIVLASLLIWALVSIWGAIAG